MFSTVSNTNIAFRGQHSSVLTNSTSPNELIQNNHFRSRSFGKREQEVSGCLFPELVGSTKKLFGAATNTTMQNEVASPTGNRSDNNLSLLGGYPQPHQQQHDDSIRSPGERLDIGSESSRPTSATSQHGRRSGGGRGMLRSLSKVFKRKKERTPSTSSLRQSHSNAALQDDDPFTLLQQQRSDSFRSVSGSAFGRNSGGSPGAHTPLHTSGPDRRNQLWNNISSARGSRRRLGRRSNRDQEAFLCPLGNEQACWESPGGPTSPLSSAEFISPARDSRIQAMVPPFSSPPVQSSQWPAADSARRLHTRNVSASSLSSHADSIQSTPAKGTPVIKSNGSGAFMQQRPPNPNSDITRRDSSKLVSPSRSTLKYEGVSKKEGRKAMSSDVSRDPSVDSIPSQSLPSTSEPTVSSEFDTKDHQSNDEIAATKHHPGDDELVATKNQINEDAEAIKQSPTAMKQDKQELNRSDDSLRNLKDSLRTDTPTKNRNGPTEIEIALGIFKPLRGSDETWKAIETGNIVESTCFSCTYDLHCLDDAEFVLCPLCRVIGPVKANLLGFEYGVGLGVKPEQLRRWRAEIERERR